MRSQQEQFERAAALVARQLGELPLRRAPASLEMRVLAAIASGATQSLGAEVPWYRSNYRNWPLPAQILFALVSALVAHWVMQQLGSVATPASAQLAGAELRSSWSLLQTLSGVGTSVADSLRLLAHSLPRNLVLVIAAGALSSYALLAGASAFVYRSVSR